MKNRLLIIYSVIFNLGFLSAQIKNTNEIIQKSNEELKSLVGNEMFKYFNLEKDSYFQILKKNGQTKWQKLKPNKNINGDFKNAQIMYYFNHPEFQFQTNRTTTIKFDNNLKLINKPFIEFIPEYLKNKYAKKWISEEQIDKIIAKIEFKRSTIPKHKQLIFDDKTNSYYWEITNTLSEKPKVSEVEILKISPINGEIIERKQETQFTY